MPSLLEPAELTEAKPRKEIAEPVLEKEETVAVKDMTRIWRVQFDANRCIEVFMERVFVSADGKEYGAEKLPVIRRSFDELAGNAAVFAWLSQIDAFARVWREEDLFVPEVEENPLLEVPLGKG
jgi:hypothetical protein